MPQKLDITNQRFGKLTAITPVPSRSGKTYWLCKCDCGREKEVQTCHLRSGKTISCGCLNKPLPPRYCQNCGIQLHKGQYKYCSNHCQLDFQRKQIVNKIFTNELSGLKRATSSRPKIRDSLRSFLLQQAQYKCELCGCDWVNPYSHQTILEIHHIDGRSD